MIIVSKILESHPPMLDHAQYLMLLNEIDWRSSIQFIIDSYQESKLLLLNFTALIQALLATGFAYHGIKKVRKLVNSYMAKKYREHEARWEIESNAIKERINRKILSNQDAKPNERNQLLRYSQQLSDLVRATQRSS